MHLDPSMIVCECGWNVYCTDRQAGMFKCQNPKCPQYQKLMRVAVEAQPVESKPTNSAPLSTEYLDRR